jgi:hypothetical protein
MSTPPLVSPEPASNESAGRPPRRITGLKIVAGAAFGLVLSLGLCKVGFYLDRNVHDGAPSTIDAIGGLGFVLSVIALSVGVLITVIEAILNHSQKRKP